MERQALRLDYGEVLNSSVPLMTVVAKTRTTIINHYWQEFHSGLAYINLNELIVKPHTHFHNIQQQV